MYDARVINKVTMLLTLFTAVHTVAMEEPERRGFNSPRPPQKKLPKVLRNDNQKQNAEAHQRPFAPRESVDLVMSYGNHNPLLRAAAGAAAYQKSISPTTSQSPSPSRDSILERMPPRSYSHSQGSKELENKKKAVQGEAPSIAAQKNIKGEKAAEREEYDMVMKPQQEWQEAAQVAAAQRQALHEREAAQKTEEVRKKKAWWCCS